MTTSTSAISTAALTKHYPDAAAVTDLTLEVPEGAIFGFLGPNGAGKSTTIKLLAGLARPTSGSAFVGGVPVEAGPGYRQQVGYLSQEPRFYDWMSGRDVLRFVASLHAGESRANAGQIDRVLARVGLADAADRRTGTYSGGMRQRLGIAQALIGAPAVLLLDEPVSALDPIGRREVLDLMRELRGEATVFYSTHILDDVERVSTHVAILDGGRLLRSATTADLLESSSHDRLRVVIGRADDRTALGLAAIAGVASVEPSERNDASRSYLVRVRPDATTPVQMEVGRYAADHDLILIENHPVQLGLEDVFLRLVDTKERVA